MTPQESVWRRGGEASHFFPVLCPSVEPAPPQGRTVDIWSALISSHCNDSDEITLSLSAEAAAHPSQPGLNPGHLRQRAVNRAHRLSPCSAQTHKDRGGGGVQDAHPPPPPEHQWQAGRLTANTTRPCGLWWLWQITVWVQGLPPFSPAPIWGGQREGAGRLVWRGQSFARADAELSVISRLRGEKKERKKDPFQVDNNSWGRNHWDWTSEAN